MVMEYRKPIRLKLRMEDNVVVDESDYYVTEVFTIPIPSLVLELEDVFKDIFPEIYLRNGLYLPESKIPIIEFGVPYRTNTGEMVTINGITDLEDVFNKYMFIVIDNRTVLNREAYNSIKNILSDRVTYPVILNSFIDFIVGNFQVEENPESQLLFEDFMGVTNDIKLVSPILERIYSVEDYLYSLGVVNQQYLNLILERLKYLENIIYDKLRNDIIATYRVKTKNGFMYIEKLPSPSTRRYYLNIEKQKQGV